MGDGLSRVPQWPVRDSGSAARGRHDSPRATSSSLLLRRSPADFPPRVQDAASLALRYWPGGAPGVGPEEAHAVVRAVYATELGGGAAPPAPGRLAALEAAGYLEGLLWPSWAPGGGQEHDLSVAALLGHKARDGAPAWDCVAADPSRFGALVRALQAASVDASQSPVSRALCISFWVHLFGSLESEAVRAVALPLVSLPLWHGLSPGRLELELATHPQLDKHWRHAQRKEARAAKQPGHVAARDGAGATFLPALVDQFLRELGAAGDHSDAPTLRLLERTVELMIDLLAQACGGRGGGEGDWARSRTPRLTRPAPARPARSCPPAGLCARCWTTGLLW